MYKMLYYRHRLSNMREMLKYEKSPTSPSSSTRSSFSVKEEDRRASHAGSTSSTSSLMCNDPFYDRFPWFRLVGR